MAYPCDQGFLTNGRRRRLAQRRADARANVGEAAALFNTRGFAGTSVNDVSAATGLDDLSLAAFDYPAKLVRSRLDAALRARANGCVAELGPAALGPNDRIHVEIIVTATRALRSRPDTGLITTRTLTVNQAGTVVQELVANLFVPRRQPAS